MRLSNLLESDKKYELLKDDTIQVDGRTLYRIKLLMNIELLGGYIESEENLSHEGECWVYTDGIVYGNIKLRNNSSVGSKNWALMDDESITTLKDIPPNIRILSIINCIKLIKFDYPFELKVLDLSKLDEFDIEYVPSSLISMSIITVKTVKHLPWLAAYPIFVRTNKTNLKNLLPQLNKIQCKNGASLKEQRIAMMQFQDILIESGKFKPEEYKF